MPTPALKHRARSRLDSGSQSQGELALALAPSYLRCCGVSISQAANCPAFYRHSADEKRGLNSSGCETSRPLIKTRLIISIIVTGSCSTYEE
ncbi:hypothetical protein MHYP_G00116990 [Metynnis hypsauchen]